MRTTASKLSCISLASTFPDHMIAGNGLEREKPKMELVLKLAYSGGFAARHADII